MILVLDKKAINNIIANANKARDIIGKIISDGESIIDNFRKYTAFIYGYLLYTQAILTLSNYIIVKKQLGAPRTFLESLQTLIDEDIINIENAEEIAKFIVDIRNYLLHEASEITIDKVKEMIQQINNIDLFYNSILETIESQ